MKSSEKYSVSELNNMVEAGYTNTAAGELVPPETEPETEATEPVTEAETEAATTTVQTTVAAESTEPQNTETLTEAATAPEEPETPTSIKQWLRKPYTLPAIGGGLLLIGIIAFILSKEKAR